MLGEMGITVALLTGSTKKREREEIHRGLQDGSLQILIGTHASVSYTHLTFYLFNPIFVRLS